MREPRVTGADRPAAVMAAVALAGNAAGVAFLHDVAGAYRPDAMEAWFAGVARHPRAVEASAISFVVGLLAMSGWARALRERARGEEGRWGARLIEVGALLNAAGCVAPLVLARHVLPDCSTVASCAPTGHALLGVTLSLDALFNGLLGAGLLLTGADLRSRRAPGRRQPVLGALALVAGAASLPVALQFTSAKAAKLLAVAGPLWLAVLAGSAVSLWRGRSHGRGGER